MRKMHRFRSFCACSQYHPGLCSPWLHYVVFKYSVRRQWMPWSECADTLADLGLHCPHASENTFSHGAVRGIYAQSMPEQLAHMYSLIKVYFKELNLNVLLLIVQTGTPFPVIRSFGFEVALFCRLLPLSDSQVWRIIIAVCGRGSTRFFYTLASDGHCDIYSRTSMARTSLGPWKFVRDIGS